MKLCIALAVLVTALSIDAHAQTIDQRAQRLFTNLYPYSVAAEVGAILLDGTTSARLKAQGYREATRLFRDPEGYFSARKYYTFSGALVAGKLALGHFFPRMKPYLAAINFGLSARHIVAGAHNIRLPRRVRLAFSF